MKRSAVSIALVLLLVLAAIALASTLTLDSGPGTQASGGGSISGGSYSAQTTIGQVVAVDSMQGGEYTVDSRYRSPPSDAVLYLPLLRK